MQIWLLLVWLAQQDLIPPRISSLEPLNDKQLSTYILLATVKNHKVIVYLS